jgi:trehalose 6-phosphate phosphatase
VAAPPGPPTPGPGLASVSQELPLALAEWDTIARRLAGRRLALFLDYDGTLSPIAARPELAVFPAAARAAVQRLALRGPVAVLSGRGRADVAAMVDLPELWYGGSHGFDIAGPPPAAGEPPLRHEVGEGVPARMDRLAGRLREDLAGIPGVLVESKRFSVAIHYRLAAEKDLPRIEAAVDRATAVPTAANPAPAKEAAAASSATAKAAAAAIGAAILPGLRKTGGKKVFEIRPDVEWDKGRALLWLLNRLGLDAPDVVPLYLGDDLTDEDAFIATAARHGIPILVADPPRSTAAAYRLRNPTEVLDFLTRLAALP